MRPPSHHPVTARAIVGRLYEPGAHTLLFANHYSVRYSDGYDVHRVPLPWLLVGGAHEFGAYFACHAMLFARDPRGPLDSPYVPLAAVLGNPMADEKLCLGGSPAADLWNTAFTHRAFANAWDRAVARHGGDACLAIEHYIISYGSVL